MLQIPIGIRLFLKDQYRSLVVYRFLVLILTYLAYASYHLSRRSFSIVKNVLSPHCSNATDKSNVTSFTDLDCNGWSPFNRGDSETLFSFLDSVFLFAYAFGMFFSGFIAERCNLRYFLAMGMLLSGVLNYCLGLAFYYNIHSLWFFVIFQLLSGKISSFFFVIYMKTGIFSQVSCKRLAGQLWFVVSATGFRNHREVYCLVFGTLTLMLGIFSEPL